MFEDPLTDQTPVKKQRPALGSCAPRVAALHTRLLDSRTSELARLSNKRWRSTEARYSFGVGMHASRTLGR